MFIYPITGYVNEESIGVTIHESRLDRKELYITMKYNIWEEIDKTLKKVMAHSTTDNPIINLEGEWNVHGGNFQVCLSLSIR
jgi:hypothetical protein